MRNCHSVCYVPSENWTKYLANKQVSFGTSACFHLRFHSAQMFILKSYASSWRKEKSIRNNNENNSSTLSRSFVGVPPHLATLDFSQSVIRRQTKRITVGLSMFRGFFSSYSINNLFVDGRCRWRSLIKTWNDLYQFYADLCPRMIE